MKNGKYFDIKQYTKNYKKSHYKQIAFNTSPENFEIISKFCDDFNISKQKLLIGCAKYCIDNAVDIDEILSHL